MRTLALAACTLAAAALLPADQLLVANKGDQAVGIIDPGSNKQLAEIPEGGTTVHELIASRDGKLVYAPIYGNSGVGKPGTDGSILAVIDLGARKVVSTYDFKKGVRPHCPLIGPKDGLLYVTTELEKAITVFDPKTMKVVATIPTGQDQVAHARAQSRWAPRLHRQRRPRHSLRPRSRRTQGRHRHPHLTPGNPAHLDRE